MISSTALSSTFLACVLVCGLSAASAAPVAAAEPPEDVIYGQRPKPGSIRRVTYQDLDLRTKAGERQLTRRVSAAVVRACPSDSVLEKHHCRNQALRRVRPQVKQAVYNARNMTGFVRLTSMFITIPESD